MRKGKLQIKNADGELLSESEIILGEGDTLIAVVEEPLSEPTLEDLRDQLEKVVSNEQEVLVVNFSLSLSVLKRK